MKTYDTYLPRISGKRLLLRLMPAITVIILIGMAGCRKMSHNGKLDGQWQVMSVENKQSGVIAPPEGQCYYCFNLHVASITGITGTTGNLHYSKDQGELSIDFPYVKESVISPSSPLAQSYGIFTNPVSFEIKELTGKRLVLESAESVVILRKF